MPYPSVTPAKAGVQGDGQRPCRRPWIPAFAGMTAPCNARVPAKAGTFAVQAPCALKEGSCSRRSAWERRHEEMPLAIRHPGESRGPGGRARPCRWPWIPAFAGMTALCNICVPAKAGTFAIPAPRALKEGSCFRRGARARRREEMHLPIRHPGESRGPGGRATTLPVALDSGFRRNDGALQHLCSCESRNLRCSDTARSQRRLLLSQEREGEAARREMPLPIRHPGESRGPGRRATTLPVALDSGFRRNDGARQHLCSCESRSLRCSDTARSQRRLLLSQEREGEAARSDAFTHPSPRRKPGSRG